MSDLGNKAIMASNIQYYMNLHNKDRNQMCQALGVKYTTFTDWVKGNTYPRIDKIELMANYFGINKSDLVEKRDQDKITNDVDHGFFSKLNESNAEILIEISRLNPENHEKLAKYIHSLLQTQILENELKNDSNNN